MNAVDTNLIVRYLTNDHPEQASQARAIIDGGAIFVAMTVVLEVEWVLRSAYNYAPVEVLRALRAFGGLPTVTIEGAEIVSDALDLAETGMDFADALHLGQSMHCQNFITFDQKFIAAAKTAGHERVRLP